MSEEQKRPLTRRELRAQREAEQSHAGDGPPAPGVDPAGAPSEAGQAPAEPGTGPAGGGDAARGAGPAGAQPDDGDAGDQPDDGDAGDQSEDGDAGDQADDGDAAAEPAAGPAAEQEGSAGGADRPERSSLQRVRDREALRRQRELGEPPAPPAAPEEAPLTRRQLRQRALAAKEEQQPTGPTAGGTDADPAGGPSEAISVEEALAQRQAAAGEEDADALLADDTGLINLETLARQREHAARAAVINRRIAERRRLEQANTRRAQQLRSDPFTGAMHRIGEQQAERDLANTGVKGPPTTGFTVELPPRKPAGPAAGAVARPVPGPDRAEEGGAGPVSARTAQGLDPLDYLTAGARRARLVTAAVVAALALGGIAFIGGLAMILTAP